MTSHGGRSNARYIHQENSLLPGSPFPGSGHLPDMSGQQYMPPGPHQYQIWQPALAPITGSPSVPAPDEVFEQDVGEPQENNVHGQVHPAMERPEPVTPPSGDVEQGGMVQPPAPRSRLGNFIGGFMATLRHIPNTMVKNNPRDSISVMHIDPGMEDVVTVFNSPRVSYYSSSPNVRNSRISLHPSEPNTPYTQPTTMPIAEVPEPVDEDPLATSSTAPGSNPQDFVDDGTTAVHHDAPIGSSITSSPVQIGQQDVSDYEKSRTPYPFTNPDDKSLTSYIDRLHRFLTDLKNLPWVTSQITREYVPALDSDRGRKRMSDEPVSWYTPRPKKQKGATEYMGQPPISGPQIMIQTIPPTPTSAAPSTYYNRSTMPRRLTLTPSQYTYGSYSRAASEGGATAIRPLRTPATEITSVGGLPSPGASSHGMGTHSVSYSYHYASPPAVQSIRGHANAFSAFSTPQTRLEPDSYFSPR